MNHTDFSNAMRNGLNDAKARGVTVVSIDDVLMHLSDLEDALSEYPLDTSQSVDEANRRSWEKYLEDYRAYLAARNATEIKVFESVITAGQNAIRILLAINGGAAIAVLAFLGHLATINSSMLSAFAIPMQWFSFGVALAGAVSGLTYLTQLSFSSEKRVLQWTGFSFQAIAILCGCASFILFIIGLTEMAELFKNFNVSD